MGLEGGGDTSYLKSCLENIPGTRKSRRKGLGFGNVWIVVDEGRRPRLEFASYSESSKGGLSGGVACLIDSCPHWPWLQGGEEGQRLWQGSGCEVLGAWTRDRGVWTNQSHLLEGLN